jgi:MFS family permease
VSALIPYLPYLAGVLIVVGVIWMSRRAPAELVILMITALVDMIGLLMVLPLLPFYAQRLGAGGLVVGLLISAFSVAQLLSAPMWGRLSDRWGRKPTLLVALAASAIAYIIFGYANSLFLLFLSRIVQGAGGGTVGVIQAYVADTTKPGERAKALGWLSAATNLGVAVGPVLGAMAIGLGAKQFHVGGLTLSLGHAAPGILAAALCLLNMVFAWRYLRESRVAHPDDGKARPPGASRAAVWRVITHSREPAPRLIWIYAIAIGAFQGTNGVLALFFNHRFGINEQGMAYFFTYIGVLSVVSRAFILGKAVEWLGEAKLSRVGLVLLGSGLALLPLAPSIPVLALVVALLPLGTAFTFPCVTALLSHVISQRERGLYMGVQQTFGGASRVIFPIALGWVFDHLGRGVPFWISATLVFGTIFLGLGLERYEHDAAEAKVATAAAASPAVRESTPDLGAPGPDPDAVRPEKTGAATGARP